MDSAEHEVLAYMDFPKAHWLQIHSTNPLPEAETFMAIVTASLLSLSYTEQQISRMDSELQPIMRAAKLMLEEQMRLEQRALQDAEAKS
jgi:hypothetical protein